tara:strand:+ start:14703 stop:14882 length:180 start_codon:yes stop_codon:yes gene_type:complete
MSPELLEIFAQFGPLGLLIFYLMWDRLTSNKDRIATDRALTAALSALTVTIQHLEQRIK